MSLLVQRCHSATTGDKTITFPAPTTAGNIIILAMTWDADPPTMGWNLQNLLPPQIVPSSNIVDDGGNTYYTTSYRQDNCGIWSTGLGGPSNSAQTITIDPRWVSAGNVDQGPASPAGLRLRAFEVQSCPQSPQTPNPQGITNVEDNSSTGFSFAVVAQPPSGSPSATIVSADWSDMIGRQAFYIAVLGPSLTGPDFFTGTCSAVASPWQLYDPFMDTGVATLESSADADVTATFTLLNPVDAWGICTSSYESTQAASPPQGNIVIVKATVPGGSAQSFDFTSDYGSPFSLTDGQSNTSDPLDVGTYSVAETPVVGWNTTTDSDPTSIVVTAGDTTTVIFTNTEQHIITTKATVPGGSGQAFLFTPSWGAPFTLLDGQSNDSGPLDVGTYSIVETPVTDWVTTVSEDPSAIVIGAGDSVTITFTNTFNPTPPPTPCVDTAGCPFTLADAQSALGLRLYDPTHQFWSLPELTAYIVEALRTWNALASYWRDEFTFPSAQGVVWYDITDTTVAPNTLRPITVTDQQLMEVMEYHLLEPITDTFPLTWTGSAQFSVADLQQALQRRRDETLSVTGCTITRLLLPAMPGKIPLPNRATELRRVAFMPADGFDFAATPMFQDDIWALQAFRPQFTTDAAGIPDTYVISTEPIRSSTLGPTITFLPNVPPGVPGQFEVLVLMSGIALCATGPSLVTVPDDWTWVLKWGAMADLLRRESNAKDSLRAKYCEARYKQGLALLSVAPALLTMRWNNLPLQIDAVKAADEYRPNWEGGVQDVPDSVITAGMNLLGLAPPPTATGVTMTADVIRNAPVPVLDTDCIMVTRDVYDVVLDYAAHLAALKQGGEEFTRSIPLMEHFMDMAALSSSKLGEMGEFTKILLQRSQLEDALNPRYSTPTPEGDNG